MTFPGAAVIRLGTITTIARYLHFLDCDPSTIHKLNVYCVQSRTRSAPAAIREPVKCKASGLHSGDHSCATSCDIASDRGRSAASSRYAIRLIALTFPDTVTASAGDGYPGRVASVAGFYQVVS